MHYSELEYRPENPIPLLKNEDPDRYFDAESLLTPPESYAEDQNAKNCRDRAAFVISASSVCERFDPVVPYLALNYFDRCIELTKNHLNEVDIVAISCVVLAWKMRDLNFRTTKFLSERPDLTDVTAERLTITEITILKALDWNLRPVTAFCFVPYLAPKIDTKYGISDETIKEIIIYSQYDTRVTRFKPSIIAASAFLAASDFLYNDRIAILFLTIASEKFFQESKEDLEACMEGVIRGCHELKLSIESGVSAGESRPRFGIRAGLAYSRRTGARTGSDVPSTSGESQPSDRDREAGVFVPVVVPAEEDEVESEEGEESRLVRRRRNGPVKVKFEELVAPIDGDLRRHRSSSPPEEFHEAEEEETGRGSDREDKNRPCLKGCSCSLQ